VIDFKGCESIVFMDGDGRRGGEDLLMMAQGSGHVWLPAGVQVRVVSGSVKFSAEESPSVRDGSSVVGSSYGPGYRAPPPSRVTSYAGSSAGSSYKSAHQGGYSSGASQASVRTYRPAPPADGASFRAAPSRAGTYAAAQRVPLPPSSVGRREADDWEVVEELEGAWGLNPRPLGPDDSVSSVGRNAY